MENGQGHSKSGKMLTLQEHRNWKVRGKKKLKVYSVTKLCLKLVLHQSGLTLQSE